MLGQDFADEVDVQPSPPAQVAATPAPAVVVPPVPSPAVVAAAGTAQTQAAPPPSETPPGVQPSPSPAAPAASTSTDQVPPETLEGAIQHFSENEDAIIASILPGFELTEEQRTALETDAVAAVPKLLASNFVRSVAAALRYQQHFGRMQIMNAMQGFANALRTEQEFLGKYPDLKKSAHEKDISLFANAFKSANPKITKEQLWELTANAVRAKYGLVPGSSPTVKPQATGAFVPASANGAAVVAKTQVDQGNPWAGLHTDYE